MTNAEYSVQVSPLIDSLKELNEKSIQIATEVMGETAFKTDLYFCALLNRSLQMTDGFLAMVQSRNLTCSGILLRTLLDSCLRLHAIFVAEDADEVVDFLILGKKISELKDTNGKKLRDVYLKEQLNKYDNQFEAVYNNASGYVHFSEKAFYQSVSAGAKNVISFQVAHEAPEKINELLLECIQVYTHFLKFYYSMFSDIIRTKKEYDERNKGE